jgi:hypothetical protein
MTAALAAFGAAAARAEAGCSLAEDLLWVWVPHPTDITPSSAEDARCGWVRLANEHLHAVLREMADVVVHPRGFRARHPEGLPTLEALASVYIPDVGPGWMAPDKFPVLRLVVEGGTTRYEPRWLSLPVGAPLTGEPYESRLAYIRALLTLHIRVRSLESLWDRRRHMERIQAAVEAFLLPRGGTPGGGAPDLLLSWARGVRHVRPVPAEDLAALARHLSEALGDILSRDPQGIAA